MSIKSKLGYQIYILLNKDIKELNSIVLSLSCILFLCFCGIISYFVSNSYAIFLDELESESIIDVVVCNNNVNRPNLSENMIPVYYDEEDNVWRKADVNNKPNEFMWYNYCDKMWANAVTVMEKDDTRDDLINADVGTEIPMDRINTMLVWIPRYTYEVWNYNLNGNVFSSPQEINIDFEEGTESSREIECEDMVQGTSDGTFAGTEATVSEVCRLKSSGVSCTDSLCKGKKYTHPAFTFGDEELTGFWVGKFEVSSDVVCTVSNSSGVGAGCNLTTINPLTKPNLTSWRGVMVGTYDYVVRGMNDSGNVYGFELSDDTHVIKNMEWGAVAYLSHSKYGVNKEVAINSYNGYMTGCGPQTLDSFISGSICNGYDTELGMSSSTTGNIYGVYDMNGGTREYTMANIISPDGKIMMSGTRGIWNVYSGYTGIVIFGSVNDVEDYTLYNGLYEYPEDKYYDKYSYSKNSLMKGKSKLGDGIREVYNSSSYGWYGDSLKFVYNTDPWFNRGGYYDYGNESGIFRSSSGKGMAYEHFSSRLTVS